MLLCLNKTFYIQAGKFKAKCLKLTDEVYRTKRRIIITKRNKPIAQLIPIEEEKESLLQEILFFRFQKDREHLLISPISVWEISMFVERKRISLDMDLADWLSQWIESPGIVVAEFSFQVALLSNKLPGSLHGDPADRILIASAYQENAVLVTADEKILSYGKDLFVSVYDPT